MKDFAGSTKGRLAGFITKQLNLQNKNLNLSSQKKNFTPTNAKRIIILSEKLKRKNLPMIGMTT